MPETGLAHSFTSNYAPYSRVLAPVPAPGPMTYAPIVRQPSVWEAYRQVLAPTPEPIGPAQSAVMGLRFNLESAFVGGLLGFINGKVGLDIKGKYPVDGIAAALLYALSIRETGKSDGISADLRALSQSCTSVMFFRKADAWARPVTETTGVSMSGHTDPLVEAAKKLDIKEGK